MELKIRVATIDDLDVISKMEIDSFLQEEAASREKYEYRLTHFPQWHFVAFLDGAPAGFACLRPTNLNFTTDELYESENYEPGENLFLVSIGVLPEYRGLYVGKELMKHFHQVARGEGIKTIFLACKEKLISYYGESGYENPLRSNSEHGGAVWYNMVIIL